MMILVQVVEMGFFKLIPGLERWLISRFSMHLLFIILVYLSSLAAAQPGFLSLDCGGNTSYTDSSTGISWQPDLPFLTMGAERSTAELVSNATVARPLRQLRSFPSPAGMKFCYRLPVNSSQRYLVRAMFLYGNYDGRNTAPEFRLYLNVTLWADVKVEDINREVFEEIIFLSTGTEVNVCIVEGTAGVPFISSLELRPLIGAMYSVPYEGSAHLQHVVRINFGALTTSDVRYPDDPVDRIWQSDLIRPNNLAREAPGTRRVSTNSSIALDTDERPPEKVMQTAVVGTSGNLTYRLLLPEFPGSAFGKTFFAEIESLKSTDVRAFTFVLPNDTLFRGQVVNLQNDVGPFRAYEPGYDNLTLPRPIVNFGFRQAPEANVGPILNAMEILKILNTQDPTHANDLEALQEFIAAFRLPGSGDPCIPVAWDWVRCDTDETTPRIVRLSLSGRNLSGTIPSGLSRMTSLTDIDLSNNSLSGPIPDLSKLSALKELHLEDNNLSGDFPHSLAGLGNLQQLNVENNDLTGSVPPEIVGRQGLDFQYSGNPKLCISNCSKGSNGKKTGAIIGGVVGGVLLCLAAAVAWYFYLQRKRQPVKKPTTADNQNSLTSIMSAYQSHASDSGTIPPEQQINEAHGYTYQELREATSNFSNKVGSGGFGTVYRGKLRNGQEVAIKALSPNSHQGIREFCNEVTLLNRIHHRNLVTFLGFCQEGKERILVYEFMHNLTLRDCLYGKPNHRHLDWITRVKILLDAARGLDYLHTGCNPSIIHRDVKSSNILINDKFTGKVADFGLSKMTSEESSLVSTIKGTLGYLDPEYYMNQRLTEKSDVYSFGIVLLETISAREPLDPHLFEPEPSIVQWARVALQKGNIKSIVDPTLGDNYSSESMWKAAEVAIFCVEPYGVNRPTMSEVVRELKEAYELEDCKNPADDEQETLSNVSAPAYHLDATRNPLDANTLSASVFTQPQAR